MPVQEVERPRGTSLHGRYFAGMRQHPCRRAL